MGNETEPQEPDAGWSPIDYLPEGKRPLAHSIVNKLVGPDSIGSLVVAPFVEGIDRVKDALAAEVKSGGHLHIEPALLWAGVISRPEFKQALALLHRNRQSHDEQATDISDMEDKQSNE